MPFFEGAQNVTINGGIFEEVHGNQTIHNGNVYHVHSLNETSDSFDDSSVGRHVHGGSFDVAASARMVQETRDQTD